MPQPVTYADLFKAVEIAKPYAPPPKGDDLF